MFNGFVVTAYLASDMPLTDRVVSVFSVTLVFRGTEEPSKQLIENLVLAHTRNAVLISAAVERTNLPDETTFSY